MNARFWDYCNGGWVKLTLKPGESLSWHKYTPTDEGHQFIQQNWIHNEDFVSYVEYSAGRDCDGLMEYHTTQRAKLNELHSKPAFIELPDGRAEPGAFQIPNWVLVSGSQRDHSAEAMGY